MEQLVIIAIIGLISLVNWVMKRSAEIREQRKLERQRLGIPEGDPFHPSENPAAPRRSADDSSPDMRRLMEALGLPPAEEELPPRPVVRETAALPPLPAYRPPATPKPRFQSPGTRSPAIPPAAVVSGSPLDAALRSHDGIRQAIVLREILGPPKALAA